MSLVLEVVTEVQRLLQRVELEHIPIRGCLQEEQLQPQVYYAQAPIPAPSVLQQVVL